MLTLRSKLLLALLLAGCGGAQKRLSVDRILVTADSTIEMVEDVAVTGIHRAYSVAEASCRQNSHYDQVMCVEAQVTPWFVLLESVQAAQETLLHAYRVRRDGGDVAKAMACSRESLTIVVRRLQALKSNPPSEFSNFVVSIIQAAGGARCVPDAG